MKKEKPGKSRGETAEIIAALKEKYPGAQCSLEYAGDGWKLLVMGRLSAQCTDARVNEVCRPLFETYPSPEALAEAPLSEIEESIRSCGLYRTKAKNIRDACAVLVRDYGGQVPDDMDALLALPGVGRKIANLLLGDLYHRPAVVTDTHCIRICGRLGFYPESEKNPAKIEKILAAVLPPEEQSDFCHRLVLFGRETCTARAPMCADCPLASLCVHAKAGSRKTSTKSNTTAGADTKTEKRKSESAPR